MQRSGERQNSIDGGKIQLLKWKYHMKEPTKKVNLVDQKRMQMDCVGMHHYYS